MSGTHESHSGQLVSPNGDLSSHGVTFGQAVRVWCRVAILSIGGPAAQIAVMHRILVDEKRWISEERFLHALNYCMLLPGPEAQQLATYIGWLLHRTLGGLVAGTLFVLPGFAAILVLSILYAGYQDLTIIEALFYGLAPAVLAVVVSAVFRIGRRALKNSAMVAIATAAFIGIFFFKVSFPIIIVVAALVGLIVGKVFPDIMSGAKKSEGKAGDVTSEGVALSDDMVPHTEPTLSRAVLTLAVYLTLWFAPLIALVAWVGWSNVYVQEGLFFSKAAVVTFGGAYAVLAYMAQQAVSVYGWLQPGEMLHGLGMAETTPGPLIQVVQFVGFLGAYRVAVAGGLGGLDPMVAGTLAAVLTTWVTFVPCFLWIFLGAPYIEQLRGNKSLTAALSGVTAAVVGVVLNLAVWFAFHTVFGTVNETKIGGIYLLIPDWTTADLAAMLIALGAFIAMFKFKVGTLRTLGVGVAVGIIYRLVVGA